MLHDCRESPGGEFLFLCGQEKESKEGRPRQTFSLETFTMLRYAVSSHLPCPPPEGQGTRERPIILAEAGIRLFSLPSMVVRTSSRRHCAVPFRYR